MKKLTIASLIISLVVWIALYQSSVEAVRSEKDRAQIFATTTASVNRTALQSRIDFLIDTSGVQNEKGVKDVFVLDEQNRILSPVNHYGQPFASLRQNREWSLIDAPILGANNENLGRAVLFFEPQIPKFYLLWIACFAPLILVSFGILAQILLPKKVAIKESSNESYEWLVLMEQMFQKQVYCFNESGEILASSNEDLHRHILDVFPDPEFARKILAHVNEKGEPKPKGVDIEEWQFKNGQKRFLVALH